MADGTWREFHRSVAPQYMNEAFAAGSVREVAFLDERESMAVMRESAA